MKVEMAIEDEISVTPSDEDWTSRHGEAVHELPRREWPTIRQSSALVYYTSKKIRNAAQLATLQDKAVNPPLPGRALHIPQDKAFESHHHPTI